MGRLFPKNREVYSISGDAQPSCSILKRSYAADMKSHEYLLMTDSRKLVLLDRHLNEGRPLTAELHESTSSSVTINDFALAIKPESGKRM